MKQVVAAIIGCGAIANSAHLPGITGNKTVKLKYAVDIIAERAERASKQYDIPYAVTDYKQALADPEVEAVVICTPNYSHYSIAMDSLKAGKHVFCEKPVTVNYALSAEMAAQAEKAGRLLEIGVCNRFNRTVELIRDMIENGTLGEVYHIVCSFRSYRSIPGLGGDFTDSRASGGGVLIDWGVHYLDLILYAMGLPRVKTVSAEAYCKLGRDIAGYTYTDMWAGPPKPEGVYDVDDFVTGFIRTERASISFNGAWAQNVNEQETYIDFLGDRAGVRMDYFGGYKLYTAENGVMNTVVPSFTKQPMHTLETEAFFDAIRSGKPTRNHITQVLETMKVLDAVYRSSKEHREITI